ncbi:MAG: phosphoenolpyruvate carboxylase [Thermaerobacter sp.]|nr:phosphoenolpyruvate carboxylase [Thermaerobacter sp.]
MAAIDSHGDPWRDAVEFLWDLLNRVVGEEERSAVVELGNRAIEWGTSLRDGIRVPFPEIGDGDLGAVVRLLVERMRLQNLAEDLSRVELVKARRGQEQNPPRGSVDGLAHRLKAEPPPARKAELVGHMVLTVHPTESTRRTVLQHVRGLSQLLSERPDLHGHARQSYEAAVRESLRALWRTAPQRANRPRVRDEVELGIFYAAGTLFEILPEVQNALNSVLNSEAESEIRWRVDSWIGGDRDGHPFVDADITRYALERHRQTALMLYHRPLQRLEHVLSATARFIDQPERCRRWLDETGRDFPEVYAELQTRYPDEPLRQMAALIRTKLGATERSESTGYGTAHAFWQDVGQLGLLWDTDRRRWPMELTRLVTQIETFGFHLATLDLRQHSRVQAEALSEIFDSAYPTWSEEEKLRALQGLIAKPRPWMPVAPATRDLRDTLQTVQAFRRRYGSDTVQRFLVSMAHAASDIVAVLALMHTVDPELDLEVVPVIETLDDLTRAKHVLDRLYGVPAWQQSIARRKGRQEVMLGYSDSTKDAGVFGASWAIYQTQRGLTEWGREHHIALSFFHGRGGALGRGGGPTSLAILAQPPGSLEAPLRITQQGEVLSQKLLLPEVAFRSLELMLTAHAAAGLYPHDEPDGIVEAAMSEAADRAVAQYRSLIDAPGFWDYFLAVTPIREMSALNWGSRPAWREQFQFDDLRAIPWVFSWTQNRTGIPAWYGAGTGLASLIDRLGAPSASALVSRWPFLSTLVHNLGLALVKADLHAADEYQDLAPRSLSGLFWTMIRQEWVRLEEALKILTGEPELLANQPRIRSAARWRNPQVDALNHLQVRLLKAYRESGDDKLLPLLAETMEGIALGVRNSG